jgi:hypothetical protein
MNERIICCWRTGSSIYRERKILYSSTESDGLGVDLDVPLDPSVLVDVRRVQSYSFIVGSS